MILRAAAANDGARAAKEVWIETRDAQTLLAALESGLVTTALFRDAETAQSRAKLGRFRALVADPSTRGVVVVTDAASDDAVAIICPTRDADECAAVARLSGVEPLVIADPYSGGDDDEEEMGDGWKVIPWENLVAAYGATPHSRVFAVARTAADAVAAFEALEVGVDGVVLRTDDVGEVRELSAHVGGGDAQPSSASASANSAQLSLTRAVVTKVAVVGSGDRVCVDCVAAFAPGEGLLVGSFARGLFLVHSECLDAEGYVNARPFRVNAGPLCSYVATPGGKTAYLRRVIL
eukprot:31338-Pelagococcus_subviridis.AAC.9